jgi:3-oxoacyl-[acyl-carrier-protein] synthase III
VITRPAAEIVAIEYSLPEKVETNEQLRRMYPEWDLDALSKKTGVFQRHVAAPGECASDFAYSACLRLFDTAGVTRREIDGLIVCTQSPDYVMPPTATLLQHRLGLNRSIAAFDYTLACSGYVYGLAMCKAFVESGILDTILLVTCDTYSKYIRPDDRATRSLFGDAASASLVRRGFPGICEVDLGTDGSGGENFIIRNGGCRNRSDSDNNPDKSVANGKYIRMDGFEVLCFAKRQIPVFSRNLLRTACLSRDDIDLFIFHQASKICLDQLAQILEIPPHKVFINLENIGNTVSSSIPIAIKDAWTAGKLKPGMRTLLVGFGVGLSWGGAIVRWTQNLKGEP